MQRMSLIDAEGEIDKMHGLSVERGNTGICHTNLTLGKACDMLSGTGHKAKPTVG